MKDTFGLPATATTLAMFWYGGEPVRSLEAVVQFTGGHGRYAVSISATPAKTLRFDAVSYPDFIGEDVIPMPAGEVIVAGGTQLTLEHDATVSWRPA